MNELEQLKKENAELKRQMIDIKADAIMEVANNWIIRRDSDYNIRRKLTAISISMRGESK